MSITGQVVDVPELDEQVVPSPALLALEARYAKVVSDVQRLYPYVVTGAAYVYKLEELARLCRSIRYRLTEDEGWLCDRMADLIEDFDFMAGVTAGEMVKRGRDVDEALAIVDARRAQLAALSGRRLP
jgi:hypothetical protein